MPDPTDFEEFPVFGDNSSKEKPGDQKYAAGFQPGDVLPAEWLNWFLNTISKGYNELVNYATSLINLVYPVGSIYMSVNSVSPASFLGGTWERIQDTFLLAAGTTYSAGSTGGEATHTLTKDEMPSHNHDYQKPVLNYVGGSSYLTVNGTTSGWRGSDASGTNSVKNTGGGQAHNNMPPYLAVYVWKRTA